MICIWKELYYMLRQSSTQNISEMTWVETLPAIGIYTTLWFIADFWNGYGSHAGK